MSSLQRKICVRKRGQSKKKFSKKEHLQSMAAMIERFAMVDAEVEAYSSSKQTF